MYRERFSRRPVPHRRTTQRAAFSLLELMIVLTIMVAIGAIAWPSLRRPLADSSVQQAANQLRAEIADCRQSAALEGRPRLMRFAAGRSAVGQGPWDDLVTQQLADAQTTATAPEMDPEHPADSKQGSWTLPADIVIDEVQLDQRSYAPVDDDASPISVNDPLGLGDAPESQWYLPFLPSGQTRDAVIVLRDTVTGSRVAIEIEAVTGAMRTQRLRAAESRDDVRVATYPAAAPAGSLDSPAGNGVLSR